MSVKPTVASPQTGLLPQTIQQVQSKIKTFNIESDYIWAIIKQLNFDIIYTSQTKVGQATELIIKEVENHKLDSIFKSVKNDEYGAVEGYIENGYPLNVYLNGESLLAVALERGKTDIAKLLLKNGANVIGEKINKQSALLIALRTGQTDLFDTLNKNSGDRFSLNLEDYVTVMLESFSESDIKNAYPCLEENLKKDTFEKMIGILFVHCIQKNNTSLITLLLDLGADPNIEINLKIKNNPTPRTIPLIQLAFLEKNEEILKILLKKIDVNFQTLKTKSTILHLPYGYQCTEDTEDLLCKYLPQLIEKRCNLDFQDKFGNTPLMSAIAYGNYSLAEELIKKGCDPNKTNNVRNTALDFLLWKHFKNIHDDENCIKTEKLIHLLLEKEGTCNPDDKLDFYDSYTYFKSKNFYNEFNINEKVFKCLIKMFKNDKDLNDLNDLSNFISKNNIVYFTKLAIRLNNTQFVRELVNTFAKKIFKNDINKYTNFMINIITYAHQICDETFDFNIYLSISGNLNKILKTIKKEKKQFLLIENRTNSYDVSSEIFLSELIELAVAKDNINGFQVVHSNLKDPKSQQKLISILLKKCENHKKNPTLFLNQLDSETITKWHSEDKKETLLHYAVREKNRDLVTLILEKTKGNISFINSIQEKPNWTALNIALMRKEYNICSLLMSKGADPLLAIKYQFKSMQTVLGKSSDEIKSIFQPYMKKINEIQAEIQKIFETENFKVEFNHETFQITIKSETTFPKPGHGYKFLTSNAHMVKIDLYELMSCSNKEKQEVFEILQEIKKPKATHSKTSSAPVLTQKDIKQKEDLCFIQEQLDKLRANLVKFNITINLGKELHDKQKRELLTDLKNVKQSITKFKETYTTTVDSIKTLEKNTDEIEKEIQELINPTKTHIPSSGKKGKNQSPSQESPSSDTKAGTPSTPPETSSDTEAGASNPPQSPSSDTKAEAPPEPSSSNNNSLKFLLLGQMFAQTGDFNNSSEDSKITDITDERILNKFQQITDQEIEKYTSKFFELAKTENSTINKCARSHYHKLIDQLTDRALNENEVEDLDERTTKDTLYGFLDFLVRDQENMKAYHQTEHHPHTGIAHASKKKPAECAKLCILLEFILNQNVLINIKEISEYIDSIKSYAPSATLSVGSKGKHTELVPKLPSNYLKDLIDTLFKDEDKDMTNKKLITAKHELIHFLLTNLLRLSNLPIQMDPKMNQVIKTFYDTIYDNLVEGIELFKQDSEDRNLLISILVTFTTKEDDSAAKAHSESEYTFERLKLTMKNIYNEKSEY